MPTRVLQRKWLLLHLSEHASKWTVAVLFLAAYIILEWASFIHVHEGLPVTPWDPGLGLAFGLMIRDGRLGGLILFAGMVVAETVVSWFRLVSRRCALALRTTAVFEDARRCTSLPPQRIGALNLTHTFSSDR